MKEVNSSISNIDEIEFELNLDKYEEIVNFVDSDLIISKKNSTLIEDEKSENAFNLIANEELRKYLDTTTKLSDKERKVLYLRFGLYDGRTYTLEGIGKMYNLTKERIRQIEENALEKLKKDRKLKEFTDEYILEDDRIDLEVFKLNQRIANMSQEEYTEYQENLLLEERKKEEELKKQQEEIEERLRIRQIKQELEEKTICNGPKRQSNDFLSKFGYTYDEEEYKHKSNGIFSSTVDYYAFLERQRNNKSLILSR